MSWPTLITYRIPAEAAAINAIKAKANATGWASLTPGELTAWAAGRGAYNATDFNRVGEAVQYLRDTLAGYGYPITVSTKTDWTADDIPTETQRAVYLANVAALKAGFYGAGALPATTDYMTVTEANQIEQLLQEVEGYLVGMIESFRYCGTFYAGE